MRYISKVGTLRYTFKVLGTPRYNFEVGTPMYNFQSGYPSYPSQWSHGTCLWIKVLHFEKAFLRVTVKHSPFITISFASTVQLQVCKDNISLTPHTCNTINICTQVFIMIFQHPVGSLMVTLKILFLSGQCSLYSVIGMSYDNAELSLYITLQLSPQSR